MVETSVPSKSVSHYSGAEIHRGLSVDNRKHLRELEYVLARDHARLRAALERSRDTFADFERTCAILGRGLMADAARIAREDCIRNLGPETAP